MPICYDQLAAEYAAHRKVHPEVVRELVFGAQLNQESRVLEIGCGTGNYVVALNAAVGCKCWGVDPSLEMLSRASEQNSSIRIGQGYGEALAFADGCFDFVFSVDVIHHLKDPVRAFDESHRVLTHRGESMHRHGFRVDHSASGAARCLLSEYGSRGPKAYSRDTCDREDDAGSRFHRCRRDDC